MPVMRAMVRRPMPARTVITMVAMVLVPMHRVRPTMMGSAVMRPAGHRLAGSECQQGKRYKRECDTSHGFLLFRGGIGS